MKFYKSNYITIFLQASMYKETMICYDNSNFLFYKNGLKHNVKNAAFIKPDGCKEFCLNGEIYGDQSDFTKESWRRFAKLQAFL
jgi:hypothetical protein